MVKIKDIAKEANVSSATVSRILRNDPHLSVREDTREDILRIAQELGYKRKTKVISQTYTVGIMQWISKFVEENDPYYYELRKMVEVALHERGYRVKRFYLEDAQEVERAKDLVALVCVGKFSLNQAALFNRSINHVFFVDSNPDSQRYSSVVFDFETATKSLITHLHSLGHQRIGFIGGREYIGSEKIEYVDKRELTYLDVMKSHRDLYFEPSDFYIDDFSAQTGYDGIYYSYNSGSMPTAFICESDTIAMGALNALGELNLVTNDTQISIVSYNDIYVAQYLNPSLTTIKLDIRAMAETTALMLEHQIKNPHAIPSKTTLSTKLMIRDSSKQIEKQ